MMSSEYSAQDQDGRTQNDILFAAITDELD